MFHDYGWWFMAGPIFWIVVVGVIVYAIMTRSRRPGGPGIPGQGETPLDILKKRYARGEITREQFEQMKKDLGY